MEEMKGQDLDYILVQMEKKLQLIKKQDVIYTERDFGLGFTIQLPNEFILADKKAASEMFWSKNRPSVILLSPDREAGFTFFAFQEEGIPRLMENDKCRKLTREALEKSDERIVIYDQGETGHGVAWLEYKSFAMEESVYNLSFFFQAVEKNVVGNFFCVFRDYDKWKPVIFQILGRIKMR